MDFGINNYASFTMFNKETGEEVMSGEAPFTSKLTTSNVENYSNLWKPRDFNITLSVIEFDTKVLEKLITTPIDTPITFRIIADHADYRAKDKLIAMGATVTQLRRHKQKRINKKWLKKYGLRVVFDKVMSENIKFGEV